MYIAVVFTTVCVLAIVSSVQAGGPPGCRDRQLMTCRMMKSAMCYEAEENAYCCNTCRSYEKQLGRGAGCEYGDRLPEEECALVTMRHCRSKRVRMLCCASCADFGLENTVN